MISFVSSRNRGSVAVPVISSFLGIAIYMYYNDHSPAHFHAIYGEYEVVIEIGSGVVSGRFPRRALRAVLEWHELHQSELLENWQLAAQKLPMMQIEPLE